jgi:uncharacterized protein YjdB
LLTDSGLKEPLHFQEIKTKPLNAIYSTDYKRTQNTNTHSRKERKEIKLYNATDLNTAAATILKENKENKPWL